MTNNKSKSELKSEFSENQFISDEHECMEIFNNIVNVRAERMRQKLIAGRNTRVCRCKLEFGKSLCYLLESKRECFLLFGCACAPRIFFLHVGEHCTFVFDVFSLSSSFFFLLFHIFTAEQRGVFYTQNTPPAYAPGHRYTKTKSSSFSFIFQETT